ncbi:hypothetical protein ACJX0J_019220, partial [Zea mays]
MEKRFFFTQFESKSKIYIIWKITRGIHKDLHTLEAQYIGFDWDLTITPSHLYLVALLSTHGFVYHLEQTHRLILSASTHFLGNTFLHFLKSGGLENIINDSVTIFFFVWGALQPMFGAPPLVAENNAWITLGLAITLSTKKEISLLTIATVNHYLLFYAMFTHQLFGTHECFGTLSKLYGYNQKRQLFTLISVHIIGDCIIHLKLWNLIVSFSTVMAMAFIIFSKILSEPQVHFAINATCNLFFFSTLLVQSMKVLEHFSVLIHLEYNSDRGKLSAKKGKLSAVFTFIILL